MKSNNLLGKNIGKVLIAEDSPTQAEQLKYFLENYGFEVMIARDGQEALEKATEHKPSLVISDIMMPRINGFELCKKIKSDKKTNGIPVILLTSLTNSEDVIEGLACGANNFISKPYDEPYLLSNIEKTIQNKALNKTKETRVDIAALIGGQQHHINLDPQLMYTLLISTYEAAMHKNAELLKTQDELKKINEHQEELIQERTAELSNEIKEHKKTERALITSEKRIDLAVKSANIGMWDLNLIVDEAWRSPLHDQIFGYEKLLPKWGQKIFMEHVADEDKSNVEQSFKNAFLSGKLKFECRINRADGMLRWINVYGRVQYSHQKNPIRMLGTVMDITDRKFAENEIELKNKELEKSNNEKDLLFSVIAHDLKSPFNGFMGLIEILVEEGLTLPKSELLNIYKQLNNAANDLYLLLENLLEWSVLQRQSIQISTKELTLSNIVTENINQISEHAKQKEIEIINEIPFDQKVFSDEKMLHTILRNLLSNAVKFSNRGGKIRFISIINNDEIEISVIDNGIGMASDKLPKLFKVGENVSVKGTAGEASTGLGLILCKELIEKLKGKIWAKSKENEGSVFTISLKNKNEELDYCNESNN